VFHFASGVTFNVHVRRAPLQLQGAALHRDREILPAIKYKKPQRLRWVVPPGEGLSVQHGFDLRRRRLQQRT